MKEILQEYGGFILAVVLIGALIIALQTGFIDKVAESIFAQFDKISEVNPS